MVLNSALGEIFDGQVADLNLDQNYWFQGLNGSAVSFLSASLYTRRKKNLLIIASDKEKAAYLLNDVNDLLLNQKVLFFPESYKQPYQEEKTTNANIQE